MNAIGETVSIVTRESKGIDEGCFRWDFLEARRKKRVKREKETKREKQRQRRKSGDEKTLFSLADIHRSPRDGKEPQRPRLGEGRGGFQRRVKKVQRKIAVGRWIAGGSIVFPLFFSSSRRASPGSPLERRSASLLARPPIKIFTCGRTARAGDVRARFSQLVRAAGGALR